MIIVKCDNDEYLFDDWICDAELKEEIEALRNFYEKVEVMEHATEQLDKQCAVNSRKSSL